MAGFLTGFYFLTTLIHQRLLVLSFFFSAVYCVPLPVLGYCLAFGSPFGILAFPR